MIQVKDLRKTFRSRDRNSKRATVEAVRSINFAVAKGEIFGFLGPNGAGKTTTMRMLCTLLSPTSGTATIAGYDLLSQQESVRKTIGYVSQVGGMEREASGRENLLLQARLYGMSKTDAQARIAGILSFLQLENFADRRTSTYSGGQRRIFDLASGIVHEPQLLFLDEPSTGLDPQNRAHVWEQVKKLNERGATIFLSTHYLEEADALCSRVAIIDHGSIVALGSPSELKREISGDIVSLGFTDSGTTQRARSALSSTACVKNSSVEETTLNLHVELGDDNLPVLMMALHQQNIPIKNIRLSRPSLDDVFLKLTGRTLRDSGDAAAKP
ncbi:MAG TPA: ATP-binding cassette domain-containing protein [Steroidobacteraceae bacterium]|jgi:ABC-2 type transport system ATP-binding protein|nr:ATP-binding cassette domain-containing protein [Steroidobacteraceae bacterium]